LYACLSIRMSFISVCMSIHPFIRLFIYLFIHLSIYVLISTRFGGGSLQISCDAVIYPRASVQSAERCKTINRLTRQT